MKAKKINANENEIAIIPDYKKTPFWKRIFMKKIKIKKVKTIKQLNKYMRVKHDNKTDD